MNDETPIESMRCISYGEDHMEIVRSGAEAIEAFFLNSDNAGRLSMLFCLDRYLDPWFGYNLPYTDQIFEILEREVLRERSKDVKEDALNLMCMYSGPKLDILAKQIDEVEPPLLKRVLDALGNTYNAEYIPIMQRFLKHEDPSVREMAQEALELLVSAKK